MLGILLVYFLARWVYNLAKTHNKPNKWLYGLLAVITYYGMSFIAIMVALIFDLTNSGGSIDSLENRMVLTIIGLPFGIGAVALLHYLLKRSWSKNTTSEEGLLDESIEL